MGKSCVPGFCAAELRKPPLHLNLAQLIQFAAVQTLGGLLASGGFIIPFFVSFLTLNQQKNTFQHNSLNGEGWVKFWGANLLLI